MLASQNRIDFRVIDEQARKGGRAHGFERFGTDAISICRAQQTSPARLGGHATIPYEQKTQQSPSNGLSRWPHPWQS
jgi:hypothetical protein